VHIGHQGRKACDTANAPGDPAQHTDHPQPGTQVGLVHFSGNAQRCPYGKWHEHYCKECNQDVSPVRSHVIESLCSMCTAYCMQYATEFPLQNWWNWAISLTTNEWRFNANLSFRTIRFEHKIFCSFHADHLHVALAFRREGTDLKISKYKMIEAPESTQEVCRRNGIFGIVGLRMSAYAKNSLCAYVPNS